MAKRLEAVAGVKHAVPLIEGQVIASTPAQALGGKVRGLSEEGLKALPLISKNIRAGTLDGFDSQEGIAIGVRLAQLLRVNVGDNVTLVSPRGATTPFGTAPRIKSYKIAALYEMGMAEFDRSMIFMPLAEAQRFFNKGDSVDVLEVIVEDPENVGQYVANMKAAGIPSMHYVDWRQRNESFFTVLEVERNMMFIILSIIVLVAAFNIISGLMMLVKDKGRDIGILRTMGATPRRHHARVPDHRRQHRRGRHPRRMRAGHRVLLEDRRDPPVRGLDHQHQAVRSRDLLPDEAAGGLELAGPPRPSFVMALVLSVLATLYPSWRASRLDPVEALRYE